ncbi:MAG: antibiotic biosynthesis monooxygenase [Alphaproteobacteria bacterium]|nr:antibiotic biosynthesis monooxygenase [Alphaproteobacteria bacterium]
MTAAVIGHLRFPPESMEALKPHLQRLILETRARDGCIAYDAAIDVFEPGRIRFSEVWPDIQSLEAHLVAPHIAPWRAAARSLGLIERGFTAYEIVSEKPV